MGCQVKPLEVVASLYRNKQLTPNKLTYGGSCKAADRHRNDYNGSPEMALARAVRPEAQES